MIEKYVQSPCLFLDDWLTTTTKSCEILDQPEPEEHPAKFMAGTRMNSIRALRIKTLLGCHPWGIPVMAFKGAYEQMFEGKKFEPKEYGYENIGAMVYHLPDIFVVQEPDDVTALMFPDYPHDRILHDARLGHDFNACHYHHHNSNAPTAAAAAADSDDSNARGQQQFDKVDGDCCLLAAADPCGAGGICASQQQPYGTSTDNRSTKSVIDGGSTTSSNYGQTVEWRESSSSSTIASHYNEASSCSSSSSIKTVESPPTTNGGAPAAAAARAGVGPHGETIDPDTLISYAWINRDTDFPQDVVLAGEQYNELILPPSSGGGKIPGTRGVHQAILVGVASPSSFYINVKSPADSQRLTTLTIEIYQYCMQLGPNIDSYNVPDEFIYPGFPCLVWSREYNCWERCMVLSRSRRTNRVLVEYVDFGGCITVNKIYLYLLPRRFFDLPKQAILCSLIGVKPKGAIGQHDDKWSRNTGCRLRNFSEPNYWLDVLLVAPKVTEAINTSTTSAASGKQPDEAEPIEGGAAAAIGGDKSAAQSTPTDSGGTTLAEQASLPTSACATTIDTQTSGELPVEQKREPTKEKSKKKKKKRIVQKTLEYEAIICDRNDDYGQLDVFLNETLVMETHAIFDKERSAEYNSLRDSFKEVLATIPRPENPFKVRGWKLWPSLRSVKDGDDQTKPVQNQVSMIDIQWKDDDSD